MTLIMRQMEYNLLFSLASNCNKYKKRIEAYIRRKKPCLRTNIQRNSVLIDEKKVLSETIY